MNAAQKGNFSTLLRAAEAGRLALMEVTRKSDGAKVAMICAVSDADTGDYAMVPLAVMNEGDPYADFDPPTVD